MAISDFFRRLDAPLTNSRWSWGGVREEDGAVFLRVWQDHFESGQIRITWADRHIDADNGYVERLRHIELIRAGAPCFLVMCEAVDPQAHSRKIKAFDDDFVFAGGDLETRGEDVWIRKGKRIPVADVLPEKRS